MATLVRSSDEDTIGVVVTLGDGTKAVLPAAAIVSETGGVPAINVSPTQGGTQFQYASPTGGLTDDAVDIFYAVPPATGQRGYCGSLQFCNGSATPSEIVIQTASASGVIWRGYAPASMTETASVVFDPPLQGGDGGLLYVKMVTTGTATRVSAQGYIK
ncbi:hypothetical protein [Sphingomonas sp.]|uniref:hypothetical protein n=1 Tax=Sphingomonas sp. TaxID=28214 RepID=UPI0031CEF69F